MRLRLYHHPDGARIAYRELGTGPALVLWHSELLSHREFAPLAGELAHRYRVVLPDLPLHGDSEDRPHHAYSPEWLASVLAAFCTDVGGPRPLVGGHGLGAELVLRAVCAGELHPGKLVLLPTRLHRASEHDERWARWCSVARLGGTPGIDRLLMRGARMALRPERAVALSARANPEARDLARHALADAAGNANLARSWSRFARSWPASPWRELLDAYPGIEVPTLLLWADEDERHPLTAPREALDLLPGAQLRILPRTGYLIAYDDPVGVAREISAFCG